MENPWTEICPDAGSYILERDKDEITRFNQRRRDVARRIIVNSIPEPFIGNPTSARLVMLSLNPGHSDNDCENHRDPEFQNAMLSNLRHQLDDHPFYPLNPKFSKTGAGRWWRERTRKLQEETKLGDASFAERIAVIEWFPYHSQKAGFSGFEENKVCLSQEYSFHLARTALKRGALVLGMRGRKHWTSATGVADLPFLSSWQNVSVTKGNMDVGLFKKIVEVLKAD